MHHCTRLYTGTWFSGYSLLYVANCSMDGMCAMSPAALPVVEFGMPPGVTWFSGASCAFTLWFLLSNGSGLSYSKLCAFG